MSRQRRGYAIPPGLRRSRGLVGIHRLAEGEPESLGPPIFQLYVLEVDDPDDQVPYNFYVVGVPRLAYACSTHASTLDTDPQSIPPAP